jgi:hypothetical protein
MLQKRFADLYSVDWELQRYGLSWLPVLKQIAESISSTWSSIAHGQVLAKLAFPLWEGRGASTGVSFSFIFLAGDPFFLQIPLSILMAEYPNHFFVRGELGRGGFIDGGSKA